MKNSRLQPPDWGDINRRIHPACEMYGFAKRQLISDDKSTEYYFHSAEFLIQNLIRFFLEEDVDWRNLTILDFASGYGRFTRYFAKLFKSVTVADIEQDMLDFCKREFGASAFLSSSSSAVLQEHANRFDVVFCFSLFTHLNQSVWNDWFRKLFGLVAEGGYFVISTHSYDLLQKLDPARFGKPEQRLQDFGFLSGNETNGRLDPSIYGTSVLTEEYIRQVTLPMTDLRVVRKYGMGEFDLYHDIYIFSRAK